MENSKEENKEEQKVDHKPKNSVFQQDKSPWFLVSIFLGILLVVSLFLNFQATSKLADALQGIPSAAGTAPSPSPGAAPSAPAAKVEVTFDPKKDYILGDPDAPITILEFSDFECPFCARYFKQTQRQIEKEYIDTGKAKIVFKHFPLGFHAKAQKAAEASECAGEQGKFWEYHDTIFENQQSIGISDLKKYAGDLKLDQSKFDSCLDDGKFEQKVKDDFQQGSSYGVSGTPSFFVNGVKLVGAQPFAAFKTIIDKELAG